ncbi:hypothetical protein [Halopiger xanaduensis]|uniref:Helix-hairpin-helix domain-containing protein n=1 Tax=Halopiger xanaduensis (strain DSM 18323 / JCM 14033 / SH-6) TaxID=797210 RepID=F8DCT7_HALXS|nr:hypothetical protein [Halopiger xanaduensis]AEH37263.1 hypothetical protein Halxa_2646 [Halopiger xanaduensis SH-6]
MSKKEVVSDTGVDVGSADESDDGSGEPVDIGIGIKVDIDPAAVDADHVELTYDEDELLEADADTDAGPFDDSAAADGERGRELEADERAALEAADVDPDAVLEKEYSYRMLLDEGVAESTADALRRRFSLPWSFEGDGDDDLERRSNEIRGLGAAEREWIAVSGDEEWQAFEYEAVSESTDDRSDAEDDERPWPRPTPITAVTGVGPDDAETLAEAGVVSAERLATINAFEVAKALDLNVLHVRTWRHNARELL